MILFFCTSCFLMMKYVQWRILELGFSTASRRKELIDEEEEEVAHTMS